MLHQLQSLQEYQHSNSASMEKIINDTFLNRNIWCTKSSAHGFVSALWCVILEWLQFCVRTSSVEQMTVNILLFKFIKHSQNTHFQVLLCFYKTDLYQSHDTHTEHAYHIFIHNNVRTHLESVKPASTRKKSGFFYCTKLAKELKKLFKARWSCLNTARFVWLSSEVIVVFLGENAIFNFSA